MKEFIHPKLDVTQRIRDEKNLIMQIKKDYNELCEMLSMIKNGQTGISKNQMIIEKLASLKSAILQLKAQKKESIEGIYWGELNEIEGDVVNILRKMNSIKFENS